MSEHDEQAALFQWAELHAKARPELLNLFAIPNGGARTARTGARMRKEGVKKGMLDMFLAVPRGQFHGLFIEMKTARGRMTPEQVEWEKRLRASMYVVAVCRSADHAIDVIEDYLSVDKPSYR